jgi:hypothetical protein
VALALVVLVGLLSTTAIGQDGRAEASLLVPEGLADKAEGSVSVPFSVAGPVSPADRQLTLFVVKRSCGTEFEWEDVVLAAAQAAETANSVWLRVDVTAGPDGQACDHEGLVRVPVLLEGPLGERTIRDAGHPGQLPPVNTFDALDTGLRYGCGPGSCSVADLLGPGLDVSRHGLTPPITNARAVYDSGDYVVWFGDFDPARRRFACATAVLTDGRWQMHGQHCTPRAAMYPGIDAATWRLRGKRPDPKNRFIHIWVREEVCNGSPIRPRLQRPVVQLEDYRRGGAIVIVMATTREPTDPPRRTTTSGTRFGFVDCPGMAPVKAVVDLPVPIGERPLLDGGVFPPQERWTKRK